jgi:hypothetical protein
MAEADSSQYAPQCVENIHTKGIMHWHHHTCILKQIWEQLIQLFILHCIDPEITCRIRQRLLFVNDQNVIQGSQNKLQHSVYNLHSPGEMYKLKILTTKVEVMVFKDDVND